MAAGMYVTHQGTGPVNVKSADESSDMILHYLPAPCDFGRELVVIHSQCRNVARSGQN